MTTSEMNGPDPHADFRTAMRRLVATVALISCRDPQTGERHAMTASSFISTTMAPPSIAVCVNSGASIYCSLKKDTPFAVNLLRDDMRVLAERCAGREEGEARFVGDMWCEDARRIPFVRGALATIFCRVGALVAQGTHHLVLAEVVSTENLGDGAPLLYTHGTYRSLPPLRP